jgi:Rrf2 family transcriptional regulator, cysteine metabolism repressor
MKLSTRARYALRGMKEISEQSKEGKPVKLKDVADNTDIPYRYLQQLAIELKEAGLLKTKQGRNGGHLLTRPADRIKLGEIVEATIGKINIVNCVLEPKTCAKAKDCTCRDVYCLLNKRMVETLNELFLSDLEKDTVLNKL